MVISRYWKVIIILAIFGGLGLWAKDDKLVLDGEIFQLETFVIYESEVDVYDGFTGKKYKDMTNDVVWDFADSFNDILLRYHKKLLIHEIRHLNFRLTDGLAFEEELADLAASFGMPGFEVENDEWLIKEKAILHRLSKDPFYQIEALIVWDLDKLEAMQPERPKTKYARDIRFNEATGKWERRVTTEWKVNYVQVNPKNGRRNYVNILKEQGLNLDTNEGFHFINRGLSNHVYPKAFEEVKLTYPIFVSSKEPVEEQVNRLQNTFVSNLYYIYDPFSWVARRNTRFRGGFGRQIIEHVERKRLPVKDRSWFNPVLARLLSDVITIKRHGIQEIYSLYGYQRFHLSPNILGEDLDLLNWHKGEKRKGKHKGENTKVWINWKNPGGARFIVLDAYMRYTDQFIDALRTKLASVEKRVSGQALMQEVIEAVSGAPFEVYLKHAIKAQKDMIYKYKDVDTTWDIRAF